MTTDAMVGPSAPPTLWRPAAIALALWFGALLVVTPAFEPTRDVFVLAPPHMIAALPAGDAVIVDTVGAFTRLRGEAPGFVVRLYSQGAWLVVPALSGGCRGVR